MKRQQGDSSLSKSDANVANSVSCRANSAPACACAAFHTIRRGRAAINSAPRRQQHRRATAARISTALVSEPARESTVPARSAASIKDAQRVEAAAPAGQEPDGGVALSGDCGTSSVPGRASAALHVICRGRATLSSAPASPATPPSHVGKHLVSSGERARARIERPSKLCGVH